MNSINRKPMLLSAALVMALGMSAQSHAVDAGAPGRAVQGSNPSAPSTQTAPSGSSDSNTNSANTNNYNTNTNSSGSVGNGSINNNTNNNSGTTGSGTTGSSTTGSSTTGSGATGTTNGAAPTGTLEEQRRASGEAMERERTGEQ